MKSEVIVVTGASSGLGAATASLLAEAGHRVYGASRGSGGSLEGRSFKPLFMDVTRDDSVATAFASVLRAEERIDALVCCAGSGIAGSVEETSIEEARSQFETNYFGTLRTIKALLPHFRKAGGGRIVVLSSIAGRLGLPFQAFYSSSKFALEGLVEALRLEVGGMGIDVCLVEPGDHRTGFTKARRMVAAYLAAGEGSPYRGLHEGAIGQQERDEAAGKDPLEVARLVARLLGKKRTAVRYTVGPFIQRLAPLLRPLFPQRLFERIIGMIYHIS